MALVTCASCSRLYDQSFAKCPHCSTVLQRLSLPKSDRPREAGQKKQTGRTIGAVLLVLCVLVFFGYMISQDQNSTAASSTPDASTSSSDASSPPAVTLPNDLVAFEKAIADAQGAYQQADNELKKSVVRHQRDVAIRAAIPNGDFADWTGTLKQLGTNGDGNAYIVVQPDGCECTVEAWNNSFSDMNSHTLIPMGSPLYKTLINMHEGDRITVSGHILEERSMTEEGSVSDPAFITRFASVSPLMPTN